MTAKQVYETLKEKHGNFYFRDLGIISMEDFIIKLSESGKEVEPEAFLAHLIEVSKDTSVRMPLKVVAARIRNGKRPLEKILNQIRLDLGKVKKTIEKVLIEGRCPDCRYRESLFTESHNIDIFKNTKCPVCGSNFELLPRKKPTGPQRLPTKEEISYIKRQLAGFGTG